jgi:hypothetical protein
MIDEDVYRTQGSRLHPVMAVISFVLCIIIAYLVLFNDFDTRPYAEIRVVVVPIIFAPFLAFLTIAFIKIRYIFENDCLFVKGAFKDQKIKYSEIRHVVEYYRRFSLYQTPTTAPGNKQILIIYDDNKEIFISPERKDEFLMKLERRLPNPGVYVKNKKD